MNLGYFENEVYQHMATKLMEEEAEVFRHKAVVAGIKESILEKKKEVINNRIEGYHFEYHNKLVTAIRTSVTNFGLEMSVNVTFAENPERVKSIYQLTKKETELLKEYETLYRLLQEDLNDEVINNLICIAIELKVLKHGLNLITRDVWTIPYKDASKPEFYKETGLVYSKGYTFLHKPILLEDRII
jgi:hypothetical protein